MIIVGASFLKGEKGDLLLSKVQQLAEQLQKNTSNKVFNVLHNWAGMVGALDLGYKVNSCSSL